MRRLAKALACWAVLMLPIVATCDGGTSHRLLDLFVGAYFGGPIVALWMWGERRTYGPWL